MSKSQDIIGLAVISINDGRELGTVRDLIINPDKGSVEYLMVESDVWYLGAQVIPFQLLQGVGEYAVTVESDEALSKLTAMEEVISLIDRKVRVKGTKVLTKRGRLIGHVNEYFVDVNSGLITGCLLQPARAELGARIISAEAVVTFGRDVLVVREDLNESELEAYAEGVAPVNPNPASAQLVPTPVQTNQTLVAYQTEEPSFSGVGLTMVEDVTVDPVIPVELQEAPIIEPTAVVESTMATSPLAELELEDQIGLTEEETTQSSALEENASIEETPMEETSVDEILENDLPSQIAATAQEPAEEQADGSALFGELQHKYYVGKKIGKTIESLTGEAIVLEGAVITEEVIEKVKQAGKYLELIMNAKD